MYDLDRDSFEQRNLYDDPAYGGVKALMLDKMCIRDSHGVLRKVFSRSCPTADR